MTSPVRPQLGGLVLPLLVSDKDIISPTAVGRSGDTLLWFVFVLFMPTNGFADSGGALVEERHHAPKVRVRFCLCCFVQT
jgi:hypothetical protein